MMTLKKKIHFITAIAVAVLFTSCAADDDFPASSDNVKNEISGTIVDVNSYGQPIPSFTPADMKNAGFDYADLKRYDWQSNIAQRAVCQLLQRGCHSRSVVC